MFVRRLSCWWSFVHLPSDRRLQKHVADDRPPYCRPCCRRKPLRVLYDQSQRKTSSAPLVLLIVLVLISPRSLTLHRQIDKYSLIEIFMASVIHFDVT